MTAEERINQHLDSIDHAELERRIADVAEATGIELIRVAEVRGKYSAVFSIMPDPTYGKTFATNWYTTPSELLRAVLDTLESLHFDKETVDMNIFSADMFEYLSAEMLPTGKTVSLTIKSVIQEVIAGPRGESNKVTVSFVERPKKLILNKTNARALAHALGNETDNWRGATVALGVENVKVGRNVVPSVRVKSATPANGKAAQAPNAHAADAADAGQGDGWIDEIEERELQAEPA